MEPTYKIRQPMSRLDAQSVSGAYWRPSRKPLEDELRRETSRKMKTQIGIDKLRKQQLELIKKNAKYLLAIVCVLCLASVRFQSVDSSLVEVYHKYRSENEAKAPAGVTSAASSQTQLLRPPHDELGSEANSRVSTIEFGSPMKRIMDLIGHHVPVIVLDGGQAEEQQQNAAAATQSAPSEQQVSSGHGGVQPATAPILMGTPTEQTSVGQSPASSQQQLLGQPQQQHWTVLQQPVGQQNQQQQQQLVQPAAIPNEQYFAFAPFALNPVGSSNLFGQQQQQQFGQPFLSYPEVIQHQQQTAADFQQMAVQMPQSSQNHQQAQQAQNEAQPVFLSSYVPELPGLAGGGSVSALAGLRTGTGSNLFPGQQQQPNSIQQIQQAQKLQQPEVAQTPKTAPATTDSEDQAGDQEDSKSSPADGASGEDDSGQQSGGGDSKDEDGEQPPEEPKNTKRERAAESDGEGDSEPSSGSMSYEDKYDSDKDEAVQRPVKAPKKSSFEEFSKAASVPVGLRSVGLNDDCLQCICRASSGCDYDVGCIPMGTEERYCGPFQLTQEYWQRASSPRDAQNNFSSFEDCANDIDCAVETVTNYMIKYIKDCDGDEQVTCLDYALLHRLQPNKCNQTESLQTDKLLESYWQKFQRCADSYSRNRNGDDESI